MCVRACVCVSHCLSVCLCVVGGPPKKAAVGIHGLFPRRQSVPGGGDGRLRKHFTSDSATTDEDVAMATPSQAWNQVSQSSGTPHTSEYERVNGHSTDVNCCPIYCNNWWRYRD